MPVISAFAGSPAALGSGSRSLPGRSWLESFRTACPELELDRDGAPAIDLGRRPWVGAASQSRPRGGEALAEPVGPLAFAGEHTGGDFGALMEGVAAQRGARLRICSRPEGARPARRQFQPSQIPSD